MRTRSLALLAFALSGCGAPGPHSRESGAVGSLAVTPVAWNPARAPVGHVRAVAEAGEVVCVFADDGATVFVQQAPVANDRSVTSWTHAAALTTANGGSQIIAIDARGHVYSLRARTAFDDVSDRFGLGGKHVQSATMLGPGAFAFLSDGEVAVADGARITTFGVPKLTALHGDGGFGAGVSSDGVYTFELESKTGRAFALPGVTHAVIGPKGHVVATTKNAVYAVDDQGELSLLYASGSDSIHGLVAAGNNVWFADGSELGVVDNGRVIETSGAHIATDAELAPSPKGDVWVMSKSGLTRFSRAEAPPVAGSAGASGATSGTGTQGGNAVAAPDPWTRDLSAVFARSCSGCHMPTGVAGVDLSTASAWQTNKGKLHDRIIVKRSMPPPGHALSDADRAAIRAFTEGK